MSMDREDKSLNKWKEQLLGNSLSEDVSPKDDPRRVVIVEMVIVCQDRPDGDIVYKFESKEQIENLKDTPFILKEGCHYKSKLCFKVQHELVTGLMHINTVFRKGVRVGREETMIGSFSPQKDPYQVIIPRKVWEEAPKGILARGKYKANSKFVDDDGQVHLEYDYSFEIKKDWSSNEKENEE